MSYNKKLLMIKFKKGITFSKLGNKFYQHFDDGFTLEISRIYYHPLTEMIENKEVEIRNKRYCLINKTP